MDTPGYDPVSATGQVAGGANILCFTTGAARPMAASHAVHQLATNTPVYERMLDDMDIIAAMCWTCFHRRQGQGIFAHILKIASGERSKSEKLGYGDAEFVPCRSARRCSLAQKSA